MYEDAGKIEDATDIDPFDSSAMMTFNFTTNAQPFRGSLRSPPPPQSLELIRSIIGTTKWNTGAELMTILEGLGKEFHTAYSKDPCLSNIVRRVMNEIRKEVESAYSARQQSANSNAPLSVNTACLDPSADSALSPPNVSRVPSMTSAMFNQGADDIKELLYGAAERFRSDSVVSGDSADSRGGDEGAAKGNGKKKRDPKSPQRGQKSESIALSSRAKKVRVILKKHGAKMSANLFIVAPQLSAAPSLLPRSQWEALH